MSADTDIGEKLRRAYPRANAHENATVPSRAMCPSSDAERAKHELGVRGAGGQLIRWSDTRKAHIDDDLLGDEAEILGQVRFAGPCATSKCVHWDEGCRLGRALSMVETMPDHVKDDIRCPIQSSCRWFLENGSAACVSCSQVFNMLTSTEKRTTHIDENGERNED